MNNLIWVWHGHHDAIVSLLDIEYRREHIRTDKPAAEQELRLRLMQPVKGQLPEEFIHIGEALIAAAPRDNNLDYYNTTVAYYQELDNKKGEIEALHAIECPDCPWNGITIFPRKSKDDTN